MPRLSRSPQGAEVPRGTYARARLRLGMTGVGAHVVLAAVSLATALPARLLPGADVGRGAEVLALAAVLGLHALFQLPFDLLGGRILPARHAREVPTWPRFLGGWLRGVVAQSCVLLGVGLLLLAAGRAAGAPAALAAATAVMMLLLALQPWLVRAVARMSARPLSDSLREALGSAAGRRTEAWVCDTDDEGFTGGWLGLPGQEVLVLPARWVRGLAPDALRATLVQRGVALASGARTRGVLLAVVFNVAGLALASGLPGAGFGSPAALVTTGLGAGLWTFLGLLVLPTFSRRAVLAVDALARRQVGAGALQRAVRQIDRWRDDEPTRPALVETIFHPVPAVNARLEATDATAASAARGPGAWHVVRTMLFLSWAGLGLLARAVHCNSGRPALWVALPTD